MSGLHYVLPPEFHVFERDSRFLIFDPQNFIWFVTNDKGKAAFDGLSKAGSPEDAAESLAGALNLSPSSPAVAVPRTSRRS